VPEPSVFEIEMAIDKLKWHKSPGIPAEFIKAGVVQFVLRSINLFIVWKKEELPDEWKESIDVPIYKNGNKADCSNYTGIPLS